MNPLTASGPGTALNPIVVIPARMASTRLPGKPLADINGKPMILHMLDRGREAGIGPVAVACGDPEIAEAVRAAGGRAVLTDPALPSGSDRVHAALAELDPDGRHDVVVNLQGDFPTLDPEGLRLVITPLADPNVDIGTLVVPIRDEIEATTVSFVKAACAFEDGADHRAGAVFLPPGDSLGPGPALAPCRDLRLSPRGAGPLCLAAAKPAGTARKSGTIAGAGEWNADRLRAHGTRPVRGRYRRGPGTRPSGCLSAAS